MKNQVLILFFLSQFALINRLASQNIAINTTGAVPDASAMLDISGTSKGLLVPRLTTTEQNAITSPATGLLIFNTTVNAFKVNTGTPASPVWSTISTATSAITSLNGLTTSTQTFATGNTGTDFNIASSGSAHTFHIPDASATARGLVTIGTQSIAGNKTLTGSTTISGSLTASNTVTLSSLAAGADTDSLVTVDAITGVLKKRNISILSASNWATTGNNTINAANFMGSTNNASVRFRTNGLERMVIDSNGKVGIGTNAPVADLTINQSSGTGVSRGMRFSGNSIGGTSSGTGFGISLGYNVSNNKQLWLGDADYLGSSTGTFYRFSASNGFCIMDGIAGDNSIRRPVALGVGGDGNSTVILGSDGSATPTSSYVWDNGNMAIGSSYRSNAAPSNGLLVQGNVGIGTTTFNATYPEKLLIDAGATGNANYQNVLVGKGNTNSYAQLNIQNSNTGSGASSDVVATADNGNESTNYIDMGINSSGNTANYFGSANDGYLYTASQNLLLGTAASSKSIAFLTGGSTQSTNERMRIDGSGNIGIGTNAPSCKIEVSGTGTLLSRLTSTTTADRSIFQLYNSASNGGSIDFRGYGTAYAETFFGNSMAGATAIFSSNASSAPLIIGTFSSSDIILGTAGSERMRLSSGGNFGIGGTANSKLEVNGASAFKLATISSTAAATLDNTASIYYFTAAASSISLPTASSCTNRIYTIVNRSGSNRTISSFTDLTGTAVTNVANNNSIDVISNGSAWLQIR